MAKVTKVVWPQNGDPFFNTTTIVLGPLVRRPRPEAPKDPEPEEEPDAEDSPSPSPKTSEQ